MYQLSQTIPEEEPIEPEVDDEKHKGRIETPSTTSMGFTSSTVTVPQVFDDIDTTEEETNITKIHEGLPHKDFTEEDELDRKKRIVAGLAAFNSLIILIAILVVVTYNEEPVYVPPTKSPTMSPTSAPPTASPTTRNPTPAPTYMPGSVVQTFRRTFFVAATDRIDLWADALSGPIPTDLGLLTKLTWLDLCCNHLSGEIPSEIGLLTKLTRLTLSSNNFRGSLPSELAQLTELQEMNLGDNHLSGTIHSEMGLMTALTNLDLGGNELISGTIPSELGLLTDLGGLKLNNNRLDGNITEELGSLTRLGELDLLNNELTGRIPGRLCQVPTLRRIIVDCDPKPYTVDCPCSTCRCTSKWSHWWGGGRQ